MAKIQARNVDDALYLRIEQSAMKNERSLEGEIRIALREYYQPDDQSTPTLSTREHWQHECGQRLQWVFDRLMDDNYFREFGQSKKVELPELVRLARLLGVSPGLLMDSLDGHREITFGLADELVKKFAVSADWLLSGTGSPFPVARIGNAYREFFLPADGSRGHVFELVRIASGRFEGTLFCLRFHPETQQYALGVVTEQFMLRDGMGGTGHANLKHFLQFLKTACSDLPMNAFHWTPAPDENDFWQLFGQHHPLYFQNATQRTTARWLQQLLNGEDPGGWFPGWTSGLAELGAMPFGEPPEDRPAEDVH